MKSIFLFFSICSCLLASAQHDKVLEIREYYKDVKAHSENAEPDSIWYYSDQIIRNTNDFQWRAIGTFHDTLIFWYSDPMEAAYLDETQSRDSTWALALVTCSSQMSGMTQYREWLFKDGKLIFHFDKLNGYDEESTWEYRYYFDNDKLIRFMQGGQIISFEDDPNVILQSGKDLLILFSKMIVF